MHFVDLKKAYDLLPINQPQEALYVNRINPTTIRALKNIYKDGVNLVKCGGNTLKEIKASKGLSQGW